MDGGWTIAKDLLTFERNMIAGSQGGSSAPAQKVDPMITEARKYVGPAEGKLSDPFMRDAITQQLMDEQAMALALKHFNDELKIGAAPGAKASMFKYLGSEVGKRRYETQLKFGGTQYLGWEGEDFTPADLGVTRGWLRSRAYSIEGGTTEIQHNVVAKRVLTLPMS
jgi:acyl-CoA dehydrogenase